MMKSNIDLTSNEMFSKPVRNIPRRKIVASDRSISDYYELIFTGNKEKRTVKELCRRENSGNYCDCCGASLIKIPWDRTWGLCKQCLADIEKRYNDKFPYKFPWGKVPEMRARRGVNPLFW